MAGGQLERLARGQRRRAVRRRARARARRAARRPARRTRSRRRRRRRARPARRPRAAAGPARCPAPSRPLEVGQCATPVPVAPICCASPPFRWTQCASQTSSPSQPSSSTYSSGRTPKRSRQNVLLVVGLGEVGVQAHAARAGELGGLAHQLAGDARTATWGRARSAPSRPAPGRGSGRSPRRSRRGSRRGPRRRRRAGGRRRSRPRSIAPRHGWKRRPIARAASISTASRSPARAREDVVVVGRGRAARAGERGEAGARRGVDDRRVDVLPDRVERDEPLEQRRLLRVAARGVLVEVVVAVDEPGRGELAAAVDPARPLEVGAARARGRPRRSGRPRSRCGRRRARAARRRRWRSRSPR